MASRLLFAEMPSDGNILNAVQDGNMYTGIVKTWPGVYDIHFIPCSKFINVTLGKAGAGYVCYSNITNSSVTISCYNSSGILTDSPFSVTIHCIA